MHQTLYEYLILNKYLSLPGIGTIHLHWNSASLDFANKQMIPAHHYFTLDTDSDKPSRYFFEWIANTLNIKEWDAIRLVNDFTYYLKDQVSQNGESEWKNIGAFYRDEKGILMLRSVDEQINSLAPVIAEKVIREKAEHTVLVGESEKTSVEMEEYFSEKENAGDYTWMIAVVLTILALMFIGWYLSENGLIPSAAGNRTFIFTS